MISQFLFPFVALVFGAIYIYQSWKLRQQAIALADVPQVADVIMAQSIDKATIAAIDVYYVVALVIGAVISGLSDSPYWLPVWIAIFIIVRSAALALTREGWQDRLGLSWRLRVVQAGQVAFAAALIASIVAAVSFMIRPTFSYDAEQTRVLTPQVKPGGELVVQLVGHVEPVTANTDIHYSIVCGAYRYDYPALTRPSVVNEQVDFDFPWTVQLPDDIPPGTCDYVHVAQQRGRQATGFSVQFEVHR